MVDENQRYYYHKLLLVQYRNDDSSKRISCNLASPYVLDAKRWYICYDLDQIFPDGEKSTRCR